MRMLREWRERTVTMFVNYREDNNEVICDADNTFNHDEYNGVNCSDNSEIISDDNSDVKKTTLYVMVL
jgi:hypothetical protein